LRDRRDVAALEAGQLTLVCARLAFTAAASDRTRARDSAPGVWNRQVTDVHLRRGPAGRSAASPWPGAYAEGVALFAVYPSQRFLAAKVRVFIDYLAERAAGLRGTPMDDP